MLQRVLREESFVITLEVRNSPPVGVSYRNLHILESPSLINRSSIVVLLAWFAAVIALSGCGAIPGLPSSGRATPIPPSPVATLIEETAEPTALGGIARAVTFTPEAPTSTNAPPATITLAATETPLPSNTPAPTITFTPAAADGTLTITHGPLSGEITDTSAILWARAGMEGNLTFSISEAGSTAPALTLVMAVDPTKDYIAKARVEGLKPQTAYNYSVTLDSGGQTSRPAVGQFTTAPSKDTTAPFNFVMGADIGGQGFCRDARNGWTIFDTMLNLKPAFFLMTGDGVYEDTACDPPNVPGSEGPFRDLAGFRNRYKYTLSDPHYAAFLAKTPAFPTWDDHEIVNDFGGPALTAINPQLFVDGREAFFNYWPLMGTEADPYQIYRSFSYGTNADFFILDTRSYRDPNINFDPSPVTLVPKTMLGAAQKQWLKDGLTNSTATWKFVITSVPLSYPTGFPQPQIDGRDGWANFTEQSGYETELGELIAFIEGHGIKNVIFLTADVHWPFVMGYDPDRDGTADFYEFGSGPISALTLAPEPIPDPTFNPTVLYAEGTFQGDLFNFGALAIGEDGKLTYRVIDRAGKEHYTLTLDPVK